MLLQDYWRRLKIAPMIAFWQLDCHQNHLGSLVSLSSEERLAPAVFPATTASWLPVSIACLMVICY
jgi:hypothetical protein